MGTPLDAPRPSRVAIAEFGALNPQKITTALFETPLLRSGAPGLLWVGENRRNPRRPEEPALRGRPACRP